MVIDMRTHRHLTAIPGAFSGASADVFNVDGIVYRLFRVYGAPDLNRIEPLFQMQCEAYERASKDPWLCNHIPTFYGREPVEDVLDESGMSIGSRYALSCCYKLELLDGPEHKL